MVLAMAAWLDLVWRRKREYGLGFVQKENNVREKREKGRKERKREKPVHPVVIFLNFDPMVKKISI